MSKRINGTGTVYKLSDVKRRRPWVAKVTRGFEEDKKGNGIPKFKQSYKVIGYYENKKEAEEALNNHIGVSYEKDALRLLFSDVYTQWKNSNEQLSDSSKTSYNAAFNALSHLHDLYFDSIKTADIELAIVTMFDLISKEETTDVLENIIICHRDTNEEKGDKFPAWKANGRRFHAIRVRGSRIAYELVEDKD